MPTQPERSKATRAELLATARSLFAERGYNSVGTEEIARAAGVTRGALYHQFGSKRDLFLAVFEAIEAELAQRVATDALSLDDRWAANLAAIDAFLDACLEPEVQRIALLDAPSVLGWETWREVESRYGLGLIKLSLAGLIEEGEIREQPVEPLAHALLGALAEAGLYVARADDVSAARTQMSAALGSLLEGLRAG